MGYSTRHVDGDDGDGEVPAWAFAPSMLALGSELELLTTETESMMTRMDDTYSLNPLFVNAVEVEEEGVVVAGTALMILCFVFLIIAEM
jgi:hypothetical protein